MNTSTPFSALMMATALGASIMLATASPAQAVLIGNGIVGDGSWQVDISNGGGTTSGELDPNGAQGPTDVIYSYNHFIDVGANGGGVSLGSTTITTNAFQSGANQVTSGGSFLGANGTINWTAVSSIASGSSVYQTSLTFSSSNPFGTVRVIQYLDEDVLGASDDHLIVLGTPGAADFQLLTIDDTDDVGVSHGAGYLTATGMSYIGWAADQYSDLLSAINGAGAAYSITGEVDTTNLPPIADSRFPGAPAYGPRDITSAIAFDFNLDATEATVTFTLGGLPSGRPVEQPSAIPEPASLLLFGAGMAGLAMIRRRGQA